MANTQQTRFFPGDRVEVRSVNEILATLDENGTLENLPFMPEMTAFAGPQFRVSHSTRQREIKDTVLLEGATCDGVFHRLCPRQSLLFWCECWLEKVNGSTGS